MPTVARLGSFRVVIYPNDHRPAHVHLIGPAREAVFDLRCPSGPPLLRENYGVPRRQLGRLAAALQAMLDRLCGAWREVHGPY